MEEHRKWVQWWKRPASEREHTTPPPAYKDCRNCGHGAQPPEDREFTCSPCLFEDDTAWERRRAAPPRRWFRIHELAEYGPEVCRMWYEQGRLTDKDMRDINTLREWRVAQSMGGGLLG